MEDLFVKYVETFGREPEVFSEDSEATLIEGMAEALRTGRPWMRSEEEQEGVGR